MIRLICSECCAIESMLMDELPVELKVVDFIHARRFERDVRAGCCHNCATAWRKAAEAFLIFGR